MSREPRWLDQVDVIALHDYVVELTGGSPGIRDAGLLESALARPFNRWSYEGIDDVRELAATYGIAVAKNHPFIDGNKRAAFLALGLFLELNGYTLTADDDAATAAIYAVAASQMDEAALAAWVRDNSAAL